MKAKLKTGTLTIDSATDNPKIEDLCGFASRDNPKRKYIFVSKVLGKHYPVSPSKMESIYISLAKKIQAFEFNNKTLFLSMAETAVGLGLGVYEACLQNNFNPDNLFIHTTRYPTKADIALKFEENHSHATRHYIHQPKCRKDIFEQASSLVLIDDEVSTCKTFVNLVTEYVKINNNLKSIYIVTILNWLSEADKKNIKQIFKMYDLNFISMHSGTFNFIENEKSVVECECTHDYDFATDEVFCDNQRFDVCSYCGREGINEVINSNIVIEKYNSILPKLKSLGKQHRVLVIGTGEFTYYPYLLAQCIELNGYNVRFQSTTRSPIMIDGIIKSKTELNDIHGQNIKHFLYNFDEKKYDLVIACYESGDEHNFKADNIISVHF